MTTFYIVRHGETVFNVKGRIQGWCDSPLTKRGIEQARELGEKLRNYRFDVCFSSSSERAIDTAKYILDKQDVEIHISKKLKEQCFGDFEAEYVKDVFKDEAHFDTGYKFCGGEDFDEAIDRFVCALKKIANEYPNANVLIVSHGSIIKHVVNYLEPGFIGSKIRTVDLVPNCSVTCIRCEKDRLELIWKPRFFLDQ